MQIVELTECVAVSDLGPPAPDQVDLILLLARHFGIPVADQLDVLVDAIGLDFVEDDRVHVLAPSQNLAEARLDLGVHLAALLGAVDQVRERAGLARRLVALGGGCAFCSAIMGDA